MREGYLIRDARYASGVYVVGKKGHELLEVPRERRAVLNFKIDKQYLHPNLRTEVWNSYQSGDFQNAVLAAMRHVEISVREAAGLPNHLVGVSLMRRAFHPDDGALTDAAAHGGEKHAMADLFAGVIGSFRNPLAHRVVQFSEPDRATELILLANHLLLIVDLRKSTSP